MNANSPSEALWEVLHQAGALLTRGGFAEETPPPPPQRAERATGTAPAYADLVARYSPSLAPGAGWPVGTGPTTPLALVLTAAPLSDEAAAFVRTWFENPRVNLVVAQHFFVQPLPQLEGDKPPYGAFVRELGGLLKPKALLSLGPGPAQLLLGAPLSVDTLRGSDYRFDPWSIVTTLDPESYLQLPEDEKAGAKAQIWKDLQRLLGKLRYG